MAWGSARRWFELALRPSVCGLSLGNGVRPREASEAADVESGSARLSLGREVLRTLALGDHDVAI